jgi:sodium transport system permease protein
LQIADSRLKIPDYALRITHHASRFTFHTLNLSLIDIIFRKELLESFRDRKTLIFMVLMPILLYPVLGIGFFQIALIQAGKVREEASRIAFCGPEPPEQFLQLLEKQGHFERLNPESPEKALRDAELDAIIEFPEDYTEVLAAGGQIRVTVRYDDASERSSAANFRLHAALDAYRQEILQKRLESRELTEEFLNPVAKESQRTASPERRAGYHLGRFLPYLILLMIINGTMYPAIDITAGEKERGTLECLLSSPPSPLEIVLAKFSVVCFFGVLSAILNLASLGLTAASIFQIVQNQDYMVHSEELREMFVLSISWDTMAMTAVLLVPFTILFAALLVAIASFADSFKEAQIYIMPLFLLAVLPALVSALPGTELSGIWLVVPIANLCLLMKALFLEQATLEQFLGVFLCSCVYAGGALSLAVRLFSQEEVLFPKEQSLLFSGRLFVRPWRGVLQPKLGVSDAMLAYAIVFPLSYFLSSLAIGDSPGLSLCIQQWAVLLGIPIALALFARLDLRRTFRLQAPRPLALAGMLLAMLATLCLIRKYVFFQNQWLPIPEAIEANFSQAMKDASGGSLAWLLFLAALSPAICEEMFFRGFLLSGLRSRLSKWQSIFISALLFGALHMIVYQFVPVILLGILLAWLAWETGSLVPGMVLHFLNNALALFWLHMTDYGAIPATGAAEKPPEGWLKLLADLQTGNFSWELTLPAVGLLLLGCWLVRKSKCDE